MNYFDSFLAIAGLIVMASFIAPHIYKVNKAFLTTGKIPFKAVFKFIGVTILAVLCYAIFAILVLILLK